jgi:hypothetical protein
VLGVLGFRSFGVVLGLLVCCVWGVLVVGCWCVFVVAFVCLSCVVVVVVIGGGVLGGCVVGCGFGGVCVVVW